METLGRFAVVTVIVAVGGAIVFGAVDTLPIYVLVPVTIAVLAVVVRRRRGGGADLGWKTGGSFDGAVPAPRIGELAKAGGPRPPATRSQVAGALARVEARQWLASPWFAVGVGFCVMLTVLFGWIWASAEDAGGRSWWTPLALAPIMAHPMVGMSVVGAHHALTRGRRDGAGDIFDACPTTNETRAAGHLRAGWVPAVAIALFLLVLTTSISVRNDRMYGPTDLRIAGDVLTAIVLAGCGVWLGVALGSWAPWRLVPVVAVAAVLPLLIGLGNIGDPHWSNMRQLSTWPRYPDHDLLFTAPPIWWHLVWIAALGALMGVIALAKGPRTQRLVSTGAAVVLIAVIAAIAQTRPLSDGEARRIASMVTTPERHQVCRAAPPIEFCAYREYAGYLEYAEQHVAAVAAALPSATPTMVFRQEFDGEIDVLGPEVAAAIAANPGAPSNHLPMDFNATDASLMAVRIRAGLAATGLPTRALSGGIPTVVAGQARGVVALWLAARGLDPAAARDLASHHFEPSQGGPDVAPTALDLGMAWPDPCVAGAPPVAWSAQDLGAARALLERPATDVHRLLLEQWERFTHPAATTDELLVAAGLAPVGASDQITAVPVECDY